MAIQSLKNQFVGINPHLHSLLQNIPAGWQIFHTLQIGHLVEAIYKVLPRGYVVDGTRSMQIREYHPTTGKPIWVKKDRRPQPDVSIIDTMPSLTRAISTTMPAASTPTLLLPAIEAIEEDEEIYFTAITIRELVPEENELGKPIVWLELLLPSNKLGEGEFQYGEKRISTIHGGIVLVELDYLHQTPSPVAKLPSYPDGDKGAYPYTAIVTDPRPSLEKGEAMIYGFTVDESMPKITIPLSGEDKIILDLGSAYHRTYESTNSYSSRVDYEREPERFDTYSPADQARIKRRMKTVQHYHQQGADLEQAPFPLLED